MSGKVNVPLGKGNPAIGDVHVCAGYKAESKVSEGRGQACLEEGLQGDREA